MYYLEIEDKNGEKYSTRIPVDVDDDYSAKKWASYCLDRLENNDYKKASVLKEIIKYKKIKEF